MENWKIWVCAGAVLLAAAAKLYFPGPAEKARQCILYVAGRDTDCIELAETIGRGISRENFGEELIKALKADEQTEKSEAMECRK